MENKEKRPIYEDRDRVKKEEVRQGMLLQVVTSNFLTSGENRESGSRQVKLKKGEIIEIRYPYAWHFRTEDNLYFHATEEMITKNCILYGKIWENVRSSNKATLEDILRLYLYDRIATGLARKKIRP